jgi:serine protease Do
MTKRTIFRTGIIFLFGMAAGIILYLQFSSDTDKTGTSEDSLFVKNLYGSNREQINNELEKSRQNSITNAVQMLSPTVVGINVKQVHEYVHRSPFSGVNDPLFRRLYPELFKDHRVEQESYSLGSGFIISSDGYILTNEHVVESAREIEVTMTSGVKAAAEIIGSDPTSDVALLKINMEDLPYARFGDSDKIILGEWAIAIGNPFGLFAINSRATVTLGVISALNRDFGELEGRMYQDMIQTDATINQGNSGGPLSNALGEVIGMNSFIYADKAEGSVGISFAIPINRIVHLLGDLKKSKTIDRNFWIGIRVKELDERLAKELDYDGVSGVIVSYIDRQSPAEKAGLHLGDIILKIGNQPIAISKDISEAIFDEDYRVGDKMPVQVWREGKIMTCTLTLEKLKM